MIELDSEQAAARAWFESLRDRICAEFEAIEREAGSDASFEYTAWNRDEDPDAKGGGGEEMNARDRELGHASSFHRFGAAARPS